MNDLELYIHIPFCARKCTYCDFNSFPAGRAVQEKYTEALIKEIKRKSRLAENYKVRSVFIGGGTPSLIDARLIKDILDNVRRFYDVSDEAEITIESNPCTLDRTKLDSYLKAGINRISIGCQSTNDDNLKLLGRLHDFETFMRAYEAAVSAGFKNINADMIFGLPFQSADEWKEELKTVSSLNLSHISVYSLILEEGTPLFEKQEELTFPDEDELAEMYALSESILSERGFHRYEISNYSKEGYECIHNLGYWQGVQYLGFGISAASYFDDTRWTNTSDINKYLLNEQAADTFDSLAPVDKIEEDVRRLEDKDKYSEFIMLGLRLTKGISCAEFKDRFKKDIFSVFGAELNKHLSMHTLVLDGDILKIPEEYLFVSNSILVDFV